MVKQQPLGSNPSRPPLVRGGAALALPLTRGIWRGFGFWGPYCFLLTPCLAYAGLTWLRTNVLRNSCWINWAYQHQHWHPTKAAVQPHPDRQGKPAGQTPTGDNRVPYTGTIDRRPCCARVP